jgi:spore maturation protein CgeB
MTTMTVRPSEVLRYFATSRLIGPQLMALSKKTFDQMGSAASKKLRQSSRVHELVFYGTPYSPRKQMLTELQGLLSEEGIIFKIDDKRGHRKPMSNREYWNRLLNQDIVIVTGRQEVNTLGAHPDVAHVEWRFTEALAAGCSVLSPRCPGLEEKMRPEIDFVSYSNMEEAADLIKELSLDSEKRLAIASAGRISLQQFLASGGYWRWVLDSLAD